MEDTARKAGKAASKSQGAASRSQGAGEWATYSQFIDRAVAAGVIDDGVWPDGAGCTRDEALAALDAVTYDFIPDASNVISAVLSGFGMPTYNVRPFLEGISAGRRMERNGD